MSAALANNRDLTVLACQSIIQFTRAEFTRYAICMLSAAAVLWLCRTQALPYMCQYQ